MVCLRGDVKRMKIKVKGIIDEDFVNYKKPSMFIAFPNCTFKCEKESGVRCCQNGALAQQEDIEVEIDTIIYRYLSNHITSAVVIGGLEPFDSAESLEALVCRLREVTDDDIVIYTGYYPEEIPLLLANVAADRNVIVKFGRYIPNDGPRYDDLLGVTLASSNQYAERIQ